MNRDRDVYKFQGNGIDNHSDDTVKEESSTNTHPTKRENGNIDDKIN